VAVWSDEDIERAKAVLARCRTIKDAAAELGTTKTAIVHAFSRRGLSAGSFTIQPDWKRVIPEEHRIKGNSTLVDEAGNTLKQWVKTERDSDDPPAHQPVPDGHLIDKVSTLLDGQGKVRAQWISAPKNEQTRWDEFWAACAKSAETYKGLADPVPAPTASNEELLTLYPLGDPHIGMLAWRRETGKDFDLQIAERDLLQVIDMLVDRAPNSKYGVLANVGDFFHADNATQLTPTSGNKLDCDGRSTKITEVGFTLFRRLVDLLLQKHGIVKIVNVPGNHDPQMARMLNFWVKAVYEREPRVVVIDNASPIMYMRHGKVLLGYAHGEDLKPDFMPGVMATDRPADWGETVYRMWITGHIHHQVRKEFPGCIVESFRTLATADAWHHRMGYRSGQSLCCITFDANYGEISRSTVDLRFARETAI
jgi:hypothetical protein